MMVDIYSDGKYLEENPTWHVEDSPWKAKQIKEILTRNNLNLETICEVGCGAGEILNQLNHNYSSSILYKGFEISPQAYELCKRIENDNIKFSLKNFLEADEEYFDLVMLIDVIEHIEDIYTFLRAIKSKGLYKLFHIPLEICSVNLIKRSSLVISRQKYGHIHLFTKELALELLRSEGYEVIDYIYTPVFEQSINHSILGKIISIPQKFSWKMNSDFGIRIFGGVSILVLTK
ncbi:MAG: Uncharacterized protein XE11_2345 [Methanomicrobiales archaeon 53_19]|uniref:class I SAM-dependent methyltransferase n=1 Tax=Methanocalculus sp. TaxID=2004547 RepID=UPI00074A42C3|nr:methyltransferase domain-containing protein [Methanocalculus sp.]KUK68584.1 MAG: Uncharacterized protein XD88_1868 [Methanocalculus sp. 52_23]KUL00782.1 MAG: Uncharacterized protein XE11_2345 [Methanomicrobiales archaeon 53_19]HIJ05898.1 class I SAM-dependent methyltransferase [Methanocalculus sp.]